MQTFTTRQDTAAKWKFFSLIFFFFFLGEKKVCWGRLSLSLPKTGARSSRGDNGSASRAEFCVFRGMLGTSQSSEAKAQKLRFILEIENPQ